MNQYDVITYPAVTEKATDQAEVGKYSFKVNVNAGKTEIKKAVEKIFKVKVDKVNVMNVRGKKKRVRYEAGFSSSWKKAVVTLKKGEKIDFGQ